MTVSRLTVTKAAMRVCDLWGDTQQANQEMQADIEATSNSELPELFEHFVEAYSGFKGAPSGYLKKGKK